ncbi:MAG: YdbL family protein [Sphingomicrobium sp.]
MKRIRILLIAIAVCGSTPALAQSPLIEQAIAGGQVGERYDGYMAFVGTPPPELRRQVQAINIRRRNLYIELSTRRNVTAELVGMATACQLLSRLPVGEAYLLKDGIWRRRSSQPVPLPDYCR